MLKEINLISEIKKLNPKSQLFFASYKFNQKFFESFIFPRFINKTFPLIIIDYQEYQDNIPNFIRSKSAETKYFVDYVKKKNTFHPKLLIALFQSNLKLWIGSNNLTEYGYSDNAELVIPIEIDISLDDQNTNIIYDLRNFLEDLKGLIRSKPHLKYLEKLLKKLPIIEEQMDRDSWILHNINIPLLNQIKSIIEEPITKIHVLSPFFAQNERLYKEILSMSDFLHIIIQQKKNNLPIEVLKKFDRINYSEIIFKEKRDLHAKLLIFETKEKNFIFCGSANFTETALMTKNNIELNVLIKTDKNLDDLLIEKRIKDIKLEDIKVNSENDSKNKIVGINYQILEAVFKDKILKLILNTDLEENHVRLFLSKFEKDYSFKKGMRVLEFEIPDDQLSIFNKSAIVKFETKSNGTVKKSDSRLVHFKHKFPYRYHFLDIIDITASNWLTSIIYRLLKMPNLPIKRKIIEEIDRRGMFYEDDMEEKLMQMKKRISKMVEDDEKEKKITDKEYINKIINKYEKRIEKAIKATQEDYPDRVIKTMIFFTNLIIGSIKENFNSANIIYKVRYIYDEFILNYQNYVSSLSEKISTKIIKNNDLIYHIIFQIFIIDGILTEILKKDKDFLLSKNRIEVRMALVLQKLISLIGNKIREKKIKEFFEYYNHLIEKKPKDDDLNRFIDSINQFIINCQNKTEVKREIRILSNSIELQIIK